MAALGTATVTLDGVPAGVMRGKTFFLWEVEPGPHFIEVVPKNFSPDPKFATGFAHLTIEAGKNYYLWHDLFDGENKLYRVDEKIGRQGVLRCNRLE